jgi:hypothetical protein
MKIDSLVVVPSLLVILWAVLAAGTIATLARMPFSMKPQVQRSARAEQIVVKAPRSPAPADVSVSPLR